MHTPHPSRLLPLLALVCAGCAPPVGSDDVAFIDEAAPIPTAEYAARRARALSTFSDGILLAQARPSEKEMEQWGFVQAATFLYYSGLPETAGAILALDGPAAEALVFLPPAPQSFGRRVEGLVPEPGPATAQSLGVDAARPWSDFVPWLEGRLQRGDPLLYLDDSRRPEATGVPPGMSPVAGAHTLWRTALERRFPSARFADAKEEIMRQKAVKSDAEIRILERNARTTVASLLAVAERLEPGVRQRETEAAMVRTCLRSGGEGPSFWPWTMSGPNAHTLRLVSAFFRYEQLDRVAREGELVRVDIGCAGGLYGADVGRTLPVSGRFSDGQAEAWDLLVTGYLAGLDAMADGVAVADVREASRVAVESAADAVTTDEGRAAAEAILEGGPGVWHIHGVGIESGENLPDTLSTGMVLAYEPGFAVAGDAYYLEDMIVVTEDGHRVLSAGLPYTAEEIAAAMRR